MDLAVAASTAASATGTLLPANEFVCSPVSAPLSSNAGPQIQAVEVDALVALKLEKHARENFPATVAGALLGMDVAGVLQITNCFRHLARAATAGAQDDAEDASNDDYQFSMMKCLQAVNADCNNVGWYQAASLSNFLNLNWLNSLMDFQTSIPQSVVLEYDPFDSLTGTFSLRAFRLTSAFFDLLRYKSARVISTDVVCSSGLLKNGLIAEIPVYIKNSSLTSAFLHEHMLAHVAAPNLIARDTFVEKKLAAVLDTLDYYAADQTRFAIWQRNYTREKSKAENIGAKRSNAPVATANANANAEVDNQRRMVALSRLPPEPSKVEALLYSQQVSHHYKQLSNFLLPATLGAELSRASDAMISAAPTQ